MKFKKIRVKDLKDQSGMNGPRPFLLCRKCGNESSANKGDYFMAKPDYVFTCCDIPMLLVTRETVDTEVA